MKQSLFLGFVGIAALLAGCNDGNLPGGWFAGKGSIAPTVSVDSSLASGSRATGSAKAITVADLSLRLVAADGSLDRTWAKLADFDTDESFSIGDYTFEAFYGRPDAEGFDSPYYYGSSTITVREGVSTTVGVTASLANAMVSINYTDAFKNYMTEWSASASSDAGKKTIEFASDEAHAAYITPGTVTIKTDVTKPNGKELSLLATKFKALPRHHYIVTIDLNNGGTGDLALSITLDDSVEKTQTVEIDLSDDVFTSSGPELKATGFTSGETLQHVEGLTASAPLKLDIVSRGGIASVRMTTKSTSLRMQGWPGDIDLIAADTDEQSVLKNLGLDVRGLWQNPDKMAVIDLAGILSRLNVTPSGATQTKITFTVTDRYGKSAEPVVLDIDLKKMQLTIDKVSEMPYRVRVLSFDITYNGANPETDLTFQQLNERGTWDNLTTRYVDDNGNDSYTMHIAIPPAENDATFRVVSSIGTISDPVTVPLIGLNVTIEGSPENTYATYAYVKASGETASDMQFLYSTNGVEFFPTKSTDEGNGYFCVSGLPAGTDLSLMVYDANHAARIITITTESVTQLPDSGFESNIHFDGNGNNWENVVFSDGWGTNNAMTTSEGSDFGYVRVSGTTQEQDGYNGKAVRLMTCGWGSGNSALTGLRGNCKYIDAGLLHLGTTRKARPDGYNSISGSLNTDDLDCGIAFSSRPTSLTFHYKYIATNSEDHGEALVQIFDENGTVLSEKRVNLPSQGNYTPVTLDFDYGIGKPKAAKIYVRFLSTNVPTALTKTSGWITGPGFGNLGRGTYSGSQLYIDEIQLNYNCKHHSDI